MIQCRGAWETRYDSKFVCDVGTVLNDSESGVWDVCGYQVSQVADGASSGHKSIGQELPISVTLSELAATPPG